MKKKIYLPGILALLSLVLTSCLDDDMYALDPSRGSNVIEFLNVTTPGTDYNAKYLTFTPKTFVSEPESEFMMGVNYAGPEDGAPSDITVTLSPNAAVATELGYNQLGSTLYTMPTSVTIKKGEKSVQFAVKVKTAQFDLTKKNGLAVSITNATYGTISGNNATAVFNLPVKNKYDGVYKINDGFVQRYSAPSTPTTGDALNGSLKGNPDVSLVTVDANTVEITNLRWAGGSSGVAGIDNLRATIDPVTNAVSMSALGNATVKNRVGMDNRYDPATKTLYLNFDWNQTANKREIGIEIQFKADR
jgi:hypothetical protein